jgi:hypothetical protein
MMEFDAADFISTLNFLAALKQMSDSLPGGIPDDEGIKLFLIGYRSQIEKLHETLIGMELTLAAAETQRLLWALNHDDKWAEPQWGRHLGEIHQRMLDEFRTKLMYMIPYSKADYFSDSTKPFPPSIRDNFPSAMYDMDEASKCFALNRHTACVFHLMCVLEVGLGALCKALDLSVGKTWNISLDQIEKEIRSRSVKTHGDAWKADEPFYAGAATHFRFVKNSWRNYAAHGKEHYDEERARDIFNSVSAFMRHLAGRLHE